MAFEDLLVRAQTQLDYAAIAADAEQRRFFRTRAWALVRQARAALAEAPPRVASAQSARDIHVRCVLVTLEDEMRVEDARELRRTTMAAE